MNTATAQAQQPKPHPWRTYVDHQKLRDARRVARLRYNEMLRAERREIAKGWRPE